jgi:hypothetical protein
MVEKVLSYAYDQVPNAIMFALGALAIPSILVGYYTKDMIVGVGSHALVRYIYQYKYESF